MPKLPPKFRPHTYRTEGQRKADLDKERGTPGARGYDRAWQALRKAFLMAHPLCWWHEQKGEVVSATVVDHIISVRERPDLRLDWKNLRSGCKPCHDSRTAVEQGFARGRRT